MSIIQPTSFDSVGLQAAIDEALSLNGTVYAPAGEYVITETVQNNGVVVYGDGPRTILRRSGTGSLFCSGVIPGATGSLVDVDVNINDMSITLDTGEGASFAAGDLCVLYSVNDKPHASTAARTAEFVTVHDVSGDVVGLFGPTIFSYAVSGVAKLMKAGLTPGVGYKNFQIIMDDTVSPEGGNTWFPNFGIDLRFCNAPTVSNVIVRDNPAPGVFLTGCLNAKIDNLEVYDLGSADEDTSGTSTWGLGGYGYGVCERALNEGLIVTGLHAERCRHAYSSAAGYPLVWHFGFPMWSQIASSIHIDAKRAGFDTHSDGYGIKFNDCHVVGGRASGFQLRSKKSEVNNCTVENVRGPAVWLYGAGVNSNAAGDECVVRGLTADRSNWGAPETWDGSIDWREDGAIRDQGLDNVIDGVRVIRCGGPALYTNSASRRGSYRNFDVLNSCQLATTNRYGAILGQTAVDYPLVEDWTVRSTDGRVIDLVRKLDYSCAPVIRGVVGFGHSGTTYSSAGNDINRYLSGGLGGNSNNAGGREIVTIATDAIDIRTRYGSVIQLLPESGTADSLVNITGANEGAEIVLYNAVAGNTITLVHNTGNLRLKSSANTPLLNLQLLELRYLQGAWREMGRNF